MPEVAPIDIACTQAPNPVVSDASHLRVLFLTNVIPPYHKPLFDRLSRRFAALRILLSTPMEKPPALEAGMGWARRACPEDLHLPQALAPSRWLQRAAFCSCARRHRFPDTRLHPRRCSLLGDGRSHDIVSHVPPHSSAIEVDGVGRVRRIDRIWARQDAALDPWSCALFHRRLSCHRRKRRAVFTKLGNTGTQAFQNFLHDRRGTFRASSGVARSRLRPPPPLCRSADRTQRADSIRSRFGWLGFQACREGRGICTCRRWPAASSTATNRLSR